MEVIGNKCATLASAVVTVEQLSALEIKVGKTVLPLYKKARIIDEGQGRYTIIATGRDEAKEIYKILSSGILPLKVNVVGTKITAEAMPISQEIRNRKLKAMKSMGNTIVVALQKLRNDYLKKVPENFPSKDDQYRIKKDVENIITKSNKEWERRYNIHAVNCMKS